jgi:formylglycine-generating enzyme required for sulfatase activity
MMQWILFFILFYTSLLQAQDKLVGKIAVLEILNRSKLSTNDVNYLTTEIQSVVQIETNDSYDVMTQDNILTLLPPNTNLEDCVGACSVDTGRKLGAALIITGELTKFGNEKDNLRLSIRFHETQGGSLISSITIKGTSANDIEKQLKNSIVTLVSNGLKKLKSKELEKQLAVHQEQDVIRDLSNRKGDLSKQLAALKQSVGNENQSQGGVMDYEAELKMLEVEAQKKEIHQKQVDGEWQQVLGVIQKGNISLAKQAIQLFLNQYNQHPLGNHRLKEAVELMDKLIQQEERERKNTLLKAHFTKVQLSYEVTKPFLKEGDEKGQRALMLFLNEFANHPLGNPFREEAENFYAQHKQERAKRLNIEHRNILEEEWDRIKKAARAGGTTAIKIMELFLKKYEKHPLGNPFRNEVIELLADLKLGREITEKKYFEATNGKANIEWIKIEGGTFMMGFDHQVGREKSSIRVVVRDFYMSMTEITVGQYRQCVDAGVCSRPTSCNWSDRIEDKEHHPINCIDWIQARKFARWVGADLPSEAQWEYAARSEGKNIQYPWGNEFPTCDLANFDYGCHKGTVEVCSKRGNTEQGLCDMAGNVWEWVLDEYHDSYSESSSNDMAWCSDRGCEKNIATRVYRGGGWIDGAYDLKTTFRSSHASDKHYNNLGFRVSRLSL